MPDNLFKKTFKTLHLRDTVYFEEELCPPWERTVVSGDRAVFYLVLRGACWLKRAAAEPQRLLPGDIVLLPHGTAHELTYAPRAVPPSPTQSVATTLVVGQYRVEHQALHPLFHSLPEVVHVSTGETEQACWFTKISQLLAAESMAGQGEDSLVLGRLAEALLIRTLRLFLDQSNEGWGYLAAVKDPVIGRALLRLHSEPQRNWSVDMLAREAGLSRSAFAEHFPKLVGETPMRYLARCRMLAGRQLLRESSLSTAEVARRVGYKSEFAFAKAFKRFYNMGPGAARRMV